MRAFRYRLAAVLKRAQHAERILQIELARLEDHLADALRRLRVLRQIRDDFHTRLRQLQSAPHATRPQATPSQSPDAVDLGRVVSLRRELDRLDEAFARAALLRSQLEGRVAAARARLLDAARARQLYENHRDGLARTYHRTELAAETKHLDDLANARFSSNGGPAHHSNRTQHLRSEQTDR